jgi:hypothetical protein
VVELISGLLERGAKGLVVRGGREEEGDDDDDEEEDADDGCGMWRRRRDRSSARLPLTLVNEAEVAVGTGTV